MSQPTVTVPFTPAGAPPAGEATLLVIGRGRLVPVAIDRDELVIGRAEDCAVVLDDPSLSRRHAVLRRAPAWSITDLGSKNGTRVGGAIHHGGEPVALDPSASFHIGPYSFVIMTASGREAVTELAASDQLTVADPAPDRVAPLVREIARSDVNVLVLGETGVGKDVLAGTLHELSGRRGPLARINCAALSEGLLESELFGHEKGAFTGAVAAKPSLFEAAAGGTVMLDEIGELPLGFQAKLLRAVESREVYRVGSTRPVQFDARIIAATNRELAAEVAARRFRQDLFYRLDGVTLRIPPLRERRGQIGRLAVELGQDLAARLRRPVKLSLSFLEALERHDWPGNVRELKAAIERALLLSADGNLYARHLALSAGQGPAPLPPAPSAARPPPPSPVPAPTAADEPLPPAHEAERARILDALAACAGNQTRAAAVLGISRSTMLARLAFYKIDRPRPRRPK